MGLQMLYVKCGNLTRYSAVSALDCHHGDAAWVLLSGLLAAWTLKVLSAISQMWALLEETSLLAVPQVEFLSA